MPIQKERCVGFQPWVIAVFGIDEKHGLTLTGCGKKLSITRCGHATAPELRKLLITRPNHVWCSDITYIPVRRGFLYLVAIMDWATRKVLAWRLSNTLDASFCVDALNEAIAKHGKPEIMNTDQGSQFTGSAWITTLTEADVKISMDGRGRYLDNIFIERLWRSLKQEAVCLHELQDGFQAKRVIKDWIGFYNSERPQTALNKRSPDDAFFDTERTQKAA